MEKITKEQAEMALSSYKDAERRKAVAEAEMKAHKEQVETYAREHVTDFTDGSLILTNGSIKIVAGTAKPVRDGKALTKAERLVLAEALPADYVTMSIDCAALYVSDDKKVRQILNAAGVQIVKEDNYKII